MARSLVPSSQKALLLELKGLQEEPVEGFRVNLVDEGDLYNWEVAIFGPPNTYYEGGYFKVSGWEVQGSLQGRVNRRPAGAKLRWQGMLGVWVWAEEIGVRRG